MLSPRHNRSHLFNESARFCICRCLFSPIRPNLYAFFFFHHQTTIPTRNVNPAPPGTT
jgi:hypothetical protein